MTKEYIFDAVKEARGLVAQCIESCGLEANELAQISRDDLQVEIAEYGFDEEQVQAVLENFEFLVANSTAAELEEIARQEVEA